MQIFVSDDDPGQQTPLQDLARVCSPDPQAREHEPHDLQFDQVP